MLLVVLGFGTYEGAQRLLPYADRPITKISVQGDLSYISQQAVQQRIGPFLAASFFTISVTDDGAMPSFAASTEGVIGASCHSVCA